MNEEKYVFLAPKNGDIGLKHAKNVKQNNHFFITYQAKVFGPREYFSNVLGLAVHNTETGYSELFSTLQI